MRKASVDENLEDRPNRLTAFESKLLNLLALLLVHERKQVEQISFLNRAGFRPAEIAALLGTTRNTVSVALSNQKVAKKRKKTLNTK